MKFLRCSYFFFSVYLNFSGAKIYISFELTQMFTTYLTQYNKLSVLY